MPGAFRFVTIRRRSELRRFAFAAFAATTLLAPAASADTIRLLSFNTWHGGSQVSGGEQKIIDAVVASGADIVAFQESEGQAAMLVADALGWHALQGPSSVAMASRFPITEVFAMARDDSALGTRLRISDAPARDIVVWSAHLAYGSYGPYLACDGEGDGAIRAGENRSGRKRQIRDVLRRMRRHLEEADAMPVFLLGDFNAPSHLDWTPQAAALHCDRSFAWPVSRLVERAGLRDGFREYWPDPLLEPAATWSPVFTDPEPQDRIDFVYLAGAANAVLDAQTFVVGAPEPSPGHSANQWPSDHRGVLLTVDVEPESAVTDAAPTLSLGAANFSSSDAITVVVENGPGNRDDWIGLFEEGQNPVEDSPADWRYLSGSKNAGGRRTSATIQFPAGSLTAGNWVAWVLYADGYGPLGEPVPFTVTD